MPRLKWYAPKFEQNIPKGRDTSFQELGPTHQNGVMAVGASFLNAMVSGPRGECFSGLFPATNPQG